MACFLELQKGGHLLLNSQSGALLLNVCKEQDVGGGGKPSNAASYHLSKYEWEITELNRLEKERLETEKAIEAKEVEIADLEERRLKALSDQMMQAELLELILEAKAYEEERQRLIDLLAFYRREEDDILAILYCLPFVI